MENASTGQMRSSNPPPACGALWRMPQLGKCARATPRQPAGRLARGSADLGLSLISRKGALCPTGGFQNALFRHDATAECVFPLRHSSRMRFSVECAFPHLGKRGAASRKSTFCNLHLTEKHTLPPAPHGKAHSATCASRKSALCDPQIAQNAPFRHAAAPGRCGATPPPGCGALWRMPQLGKRARATPRQPAGRLARGSADLGLGLTSRKSALCPTGGFRMRFSVTMRPQNAPFREGAGAECAFS